MWAKLINTPRRRSAPWKCHLYLSCFPCSSLADRLVHLAERSAGPASARKNPRPRSCQNRHSYMEGNSYFYSVSHTLQMNSPHPPNIPHWQATTLNTAPPCLLQYWEVYADIVTSFCRSLTASEDGSCRPVVKYLWRKPKGMICFGKIMVI